VLVIFFFLRSLRATIIPDRDDPVSLIGAFGLMYFFGFTINTLTLLAMVLAIGLVVDDAIVVLENIFATSRKGMPRLEAACRARAKSPSPSVAMTLTLASVFAPARVRDGRTGRLFIEFALTLAGAVMVSGFMALTLTPMMCSLLLRHETKHSWLYNKIEAGFEAFIHGYRRLLGAALRNRWVVVLGWVITLGVGATFFMMLKSELSPVEDRGVVFGLVTAPQGSDAAVHRGSAEAHRGVLQADSGSLCVHVDLGLPDGGRRQRGAAPETVGRTHAEAAADHRRTAAKFAVDSRCARVPLNPPSLGQSFRSTPVEYVIMAQVPVRRAAAAGRPLLDEARKIPVCRTCRSTCGSTRRRCASTSTATSWATSACTSRRSAARWKRCSGAARSRASSAMASSTT
jgi:multidrug efflux pump